MHRCGSLAHLLRLGSCSARGTFARNQSTGRAPGHGSPRVGIEDAFGPVIQIGWGGTFTLDDRLVPFAIHCLDAGCTEYDVDQSSTMQLAHRGEIVGVPVAPDRIVSLFGTRSAFHTSLIDGSLVIDPGKISGSWPAFLEQVKQASVSGGRIDPRQRVVNLLTPMECERSRVSRVLSEKNAAVVFRDGLSPITLQCSTDAQHRLADPQRSTWVGHDIDTTNNCHDVRLECLTIHEKASDTRVSVAMLTTRLPERRLSGAVPAGCHWVNRAALARTLQRMQQKDINWYVNEYTADAQLTLDQDIGESLSKEACFREIDSTFGSREAAVLACCPFSEIWHWPFVGAIMEDGLHMVGAQWTDTRDDTWRRVLNPVTRLTLPSTNTDIAQSEWTLNYLTPGREHGDDRIVIKFTTLRE